MVFRYMVFRYLVFRYLVFHFIAFRLFCVSVILHFVFKCVILLFGSIPSALNSVIFQKLLNFFTFCLFLNHKSSIQLEHFIRISL